MKLTGGNFYSFTGEKKYLRWGVLKRYIALILWCFVILGLYFCYDIPGSLQNQIMAKYHLSPLQFSFLYSVYSWPNIVMCFIGGFLVDRVFGPKLGLIIYTGIATIGMVFFVMGANLKQYILMLVGRFILGIGCESANVAINMYTVLWFSGKELNMVFAIVLNIGRIGSSLVFEGSEPMLRSIRNRGVPDDQVLGHTIIALGSAVLISLGGALFVALMDPELDEEDQKENSDKKDDNAPVAKLSDIFKFPLQFWLLCIITDVYINCIYSFLGLSQQSLTTRFKVPDAIANRYVSFFSFFGAALSPILGIMIDKYGRNLSYVAFAIITGIIAFIILAFSDVSPFISMFFLAISIASILSSVWSLFSYIIPSYQHGTAFGIVQAVMNVMLSIGSITAGAVSTNYGPVVMETYLLVHLIGTVPLVIWSWIVDIKKTKILNMSSTERNEWLKKTKTQDAEKERKISTISNSYNDKKIISSAIKTDI